MNTTTEATPRRRNVFVLGLDDWHLQDLRNIPDAEAFAFHPLLHTRELINQESFDVEARLNDARRILDDFDGPIDAIVGHWDFPVSSMLPILCREYNLPAASLDAVMKCSHKYWSRLEQHKVVPENTPDFCAVDPFADDPFDQVHLTFPFWLKPVKGYSSTLGFYVNNRADFDHAIDVVRDNIERLGEAFNTILKRVDLPDAVDGIDGNYLIAEQVIGGHELAPEGYMQNGRLHVHGVVDMVRADNGKSFHCYRYPSQAPESVQQRANAIAEKVLQQIGFDNQCFNMEFFWDRERDHLWIIEINPRASQSHSNIFAKVDGMSNHEVAVHVALGDEPHYQHGGGPFKVAGKFLHRRFDTDDARVTRVPSEADIDALKREQPHTDVVIDVKEGMKLSELPDQDAYSYVLGSLMIGAQSVDELEEKYQRATDLLPFEFEPL